MLQCFFHRIVLVASNIKTQGISEAFRKQDIWLNVVEGASISEKIEYPHLLIIINNHHPWGCHSHHILPPPPSSCSQKVENGAESVSVSEKHFIICCPLTIACHIIIFAIIMIIIVNMMKQKSTMPIAAGWWWWCWWWWWWESNWVGGGGSIWSRERAGNIAERMSARPIVALFISPRLIPCTSQAVWSGTILNSFSIYTFCIVA